MKPQMSSKASQRWELFAFMVGLGIISFAYGVASVKTNVFPHAILQSAFSTAGALKRQWQEQNDLVHVIRSAHQGSGVTAYDPLRAYPGFTFLCLYSGERNIATLVDMAGKEVQRWDVSYSSVFGDNPDKVRDVNRYLNSAHLFPNGDVLLNFDYAGLVKLDRKSKVIWLLKEETHHSVFVEDDGTIWVPTRQLMQTPQAFAPRISAPFYDDQILKLSPDGKVQKRISVLAAISGSRFEGVLFANGQNNPRVTADDPLHLNDVEIIPPSKGNKPFFASGDILLSLRNINTLLTLDQKSERVKWARTGPFLRQHDADFLSNGNIQVFDNRTDTNLLYQIQHSAEPPAFGYSRVIEVEPETGSVVWEFSGTPARPFYSSINGMVERLPNGNHLIVEPEAGRVLEIAGDDHRVAWEYLNSIKGDEPLVGRVSYAQRFDAEALPFLRDHKAVSGQSQQKMMEASSNP